MFADERYAAAAPRERLRKLAANRAGADDRQPRRQFGKRKDGLVGQVTDLCETLNVRHASARPGCN